MLPKITKGQKQIVSMDRLQDKINVARPYNRWLLNLEREGNSDKPQHWGHHAKWDWSVRGGCILQLSVWSMQSVWLQGQGWNRGCLWEEKSKAQLLVSKCRFCKMWRDLGQTGTTQLQQYECTQCLLNCTLKQVRTSCYMYFTKTDDLFWKPYLFVI